jgi:LysR family transcriptional regulator, hydrogen peroxide-inducible genes activator
MAISAPHPFTLRQLQYAAAVADTLSFRKAAQACSVSQPALSTQLAQLESVLGVKLFERDKKRVLLTSAGEALLARARSALLAADDVLAAARQLEDPLAGTLRLGVIPTVSTYALPSISPALRKRFPRLTVQWLEDKTATLAQQLHAGSLDAALLALEAELGEVAHEVIARDDFFLAAPKGHALAEKSGAAAPSELRDTDVLLLDDGHCFREQALAFCSRARAHELEFRATSLSTLAQMVAQGSGVTLIPELAVNAEAKRAGLTVRPFARPVPHRTIVLAYRTGSSIVPALTEVAEAMRAVWPVR